ncbi:MAG TPA: HNH endonuclease signature motif containing protein [Thermodesulfobacteriota bacterium]|nr:HNH endonuclease signature motif containing protein [Thermodesulfobacteriota bacterium]
MTKDYIPADLRQFIIVRASNRCEYCLLSQAGQEATFHVDHVIPIVAGGKTVIENLSLACVSCSLRKAARQQVVDPKTGKEVPIYNPRRDTWNQHFCWDGFYVVGLTASGRATVEALAMNRPIIVAIRQEEAALGRHPPSL